MGELQDGDTIFSDTGTPCTVLKAHSIDPAPVSYRLTFDDGSTIDAGADHLWLTYTASDLSALTRRTDTFRQQRKAQRPSRATGNKSPTFTATITARNRQRTYAVQPLPAGGIRTTAEIYATLRTHTGRSNHAIPLTAPLQLPHADLPIDPYLLGIWLGDGTASSGGITTADVEIVEAFQAKGYATKAYSAPYGHGVAGLVTQLRQLGVLNHKHVPASYLRASYDQRLALLQGLMDTDGHAKASGAVEFTATNRELADGVAELVLSLGCKVTIRTGRATLNGKDCGEKYRLVWTTTQLMFRLPRKLQRQKLCNVRRTTRYRYIIGCERIPSVPMRCITVDAPSRLYLAGASMVPTHNTFALLMEPLRYIGVPGFTAAIFRRTSTQVRNPGGLWHESMKLYSAFKANARSALLEWEFASGATIRFGHMEHDNDRFNWQGAQIGMLGFDELSHFSRQQFLFMLSRNRSSSGVRPYVRATLNPVPADDPIGGWIHDFVGWYIGEDGYAIEERCGVVRYFVNYNEQLFWGDNPADLLGQFPNIHPKSFTFIKSSVYDNQVLLSADPGYLANLMALNSIDRARLLGDGKRGGNWTIKEEAGKIFNRFWMKSVPDLPSGAGQACLFWDFAATERQMNKPDPDYTAGVLMVEAKTEMGDKVWYVVNVRAFQEGPAETDRLFYTHTHDCAQWMRKLNIPFCVRWEQEPGSAGKREQRRMVAAMAGMDAKGILSRGDKIMRGKPFVAQAEAGNVFMVQGPWNEEWLRHMHNFPSGAHDDIWDATAGAFNDLNDYKPMRKAKSHQG